ncbi:MAG TPA: RpiB/LacA/LacB family sugar-phosphate isomerase [Solirubrobacteraceae bacterium]|jgi:ribose 5-phosphate isomerase B|nr:RpiB/LacA/LacB family sugar-phosphate isomerase [Solirubrobacteraceae bacterium]
MQPIAVGADEAGAPLKEHLAKYLEEHGYAIKDYGNGTEQDYPDVAAAVAEAVSKGEHDRALLVCGTGLGMAITANKIPGVRAATAHEPYSAERARKSNDAQVLAMGARVIAPEAAEKVVDHWLESEFQGGGSTQKVEKMAEIDERYRGEGPQS